MSSLDNLLAAIRPQRDRLVEHPIYAAIDSPDALRVFMEHHVFAVWDFMTLLKSLQGALTCVATPWVPSADREARRLINGIVLAEESDEDGDGGYASHFEVYLDAMRQAGADTRAIDGFLRAIRDGRAIDEALETSGAPRAARDFVQATWGFVESGSVTAVASAFTLGREELIPDLFREIVAQLHDREPGKLGIFRRYLDRHVHLDEDEHGPMALRMLGSVCGQDPSRWRDARYAATVALEARADLWDGVLAEIGAGVRGR